MNILKKLGQSRIQQESLSNALAEAQRFEKQLLQEHAHEARLFANGFAFRFSGQDVLIKGVTCDYASEEKDALVLSYKLVTPSGEYVDTILESVLALETANMFMPNAEARMVPFTEAAPVNELALVVEAA